MVAACYAKDVYVYYVSVSLSHQKQSSGNWFGSVTGLFCWSASKLEKKFND